MPLYPCICVYRPTQRAISFHFIVIWIELCAPVCHPDAHNACSFSLVTDGVQHFFSALLLNKAIFGRNSFKFPRAPFYSIRRQSNEDGIHPWACLRLKPSVGLIRKKNKISSSEFTVMVGERHADRQRERKSTSFVLTLSNLGNGAVMWTSSCVVLYL